MPRPPHADRTNIDNLAIHKFEDAGFVIQESDECFPPVRFFDVGALVWFARIIQWEFPDFSVDTHPENLLRAQEILEMYGSVDSSIHRFILLPQDTQKTEASYFQSVHWTTDRFRIPVPPLRWVHPQQRRTSFPHP